MKYMSKYSSKAFMIIKSKLKELNTIKIEYELNLDTYVDFLYQHAKKLKWSFFETLCLYLKNCFEAFFMLSSSLYPFKAEVCT